MVQYVFDGTWKGLLSAVFEKFDRKEEPAGLRDVTACQEDLFAAIFEVQTDDAKAQRVDKALKSLLSAADRRTLFCAFLSEQPAGIEAVMKMMIKIFSGEKNALSNFGDPIALSIAKLARSVEREKHRMEAFIRFQKASDGLFFAVADPDFNVLPLIADFFKNRFADQAWLIYDLKRKYGVYYDLHALSEVTLSDLPSPQASEMTTIFCAEDEVKYQTLWQDYFKSTNIAARKNLKLHVQHVPRRYWKYLTEKRPS